MNIFNKEDYDRAIELEAKKPSTKEEILYFEENDLANIPNGFSFTAINEINAQPYFERRSLLEYNKYQRHPIPYCLVRFQDKYFLILRENGSGESRLIGKKGCLGGHVDKVDTIINNGKIDLSATLQRAMFRELNEEAGITESMVSNIELLGTIKIVEENVVENDHLGLIYLIDLNTEDIITQEDGVISGVWRSLNEIKKDNKLENWAKIAFDNIRE